MKNNPDPGTRQDVAKASPSRAISRSRRAILDLLRDQPEAVPQHAIERQTGLHGNTIREHLVGMIRLGLIRRYAAEPDGRGRPLWLYELVQDPAENPHVNLAIALADTISASSAEPERDAINAGELWGESMAAALGNAAGSNRELVQGLFSDMGFDPVQDPDQPGVTRFHRCPLLGAATRNPEVVCTVHLGIARGALEHLGSDKGECELHQFAEPGACTMLIP
ncbi:MAG TPA: helix-turn-helix domain-containing protein [Marmoricola sp.]|nr:helix-turn-helix domain-containing protein [Marmoricola sp.]HNN47734.1 helix-turn-helix domain-containing protein [Marmoricola sp.]HNO38783.1 helix-turn-helix domain-containing protein [Marmoricola sp.]